MNFWDILGFFFWSYVFISYLMVLFWILGDLFRDRSLNGWVRAAWIVALLFFPILTALVYLVARGQGMSQRQSSQVQRSLSETESYLRNVAGGSPADEIAKAKALLDAGTISGAEFADLKARAMLGVHQPART
ncbi:SHOCT domain-containing protein [Arthrobacter sp. HLT1-20]